MRILPLACLALLAACAPAASNAVSSHGVSLTYDAALCSDIEVRTVPDEEIEGPDWNGPEHISFLLGDSYSNKHSPTSYIAPEIRIYRVTDFSRMFPSSTETVEPLRLFLGGGERPLTGEVPYLPGYNAAEMFHGRLPISRSSTDCWSRSTSPTRVFNRRRQRSKRQPGPGEIPGPGYADIRLD